MVLSTQITQAKALNLFALPLTGRILIEASAGTGKTYSLALIYLRLLLGIGENSYTRPLSIDEILVVTFTKAATQELRYRIRQNIKTLRLACTKGSHCDPTFQQLLDLIEDKQIALERLYYAERHIDEAAIFTIHSFCQQILTSYAFETGSLFEQTLLKDTAIIELQVVRDFWRQYFNRQPERMAEVIWRYWQTPESLLEDIKPYFNQSFLIDLSPDDSIDKLTHLMQDFCQSYDKKLAKIEQIKAQWLGCVTELDNIIAQSGVNKRSYNKKHLPKWLEAITNWAKQPTSNDKVAEDLWRFGQETLLTKTEDPQLVPQHPIFTAITSLLSHQRDLKQLIFFDMVVVIYHHIKIEKDKRSEMGFDDLLNRLYSALQSENGAYLSKQIAKQFPVAMIDEFQDTDQVQYQIFDHIYQDRSQTGLLFIGDPKQAIYSFRGADIFTYIQAKYQVEQIFTMTTNWRSSKNMVNAVNQLFSRQSKPFIFDQIPFTPMMSAKSNEGKKFCFNNNPVSALNCYLLPETIYRQEDYLNLSAQYCAQEIVTYLNGEAYLYNNGQTRKVTSSDIAILVRSGREAEIIQQKLSQRGVKSVYLSNHQSVFSSREAKEILRILHAVLTPTNESYLHSALATQLIGVSMAEIEAFNHHTSLWESVIEEFDYYRKLWQEYGVLVMLRHLMQQRHIAENLLSMVDGERIITNFTHLGELLQNASQQFDSSQALIRWLTKQIADPDLNLENHEQRLESDENLVNIITIHKSKGLEYPLVWLPFIGQYRKSDSKIYHDRKTFNSYYLFELNEQNKALIEEERLAEDLRLLYVALTRSIYHCSIGLAGGKKVAIGNSAIGYLLLNSQSCDNDYKQLTNTIAQLGDTTFTHVTLPILSSPLQATLTKQGQLACKQFQRHLNEDIWRVTSYSELQKHTPSATTQFYFTQQQKLLDSQAFPLFDFEATLSQEPIQPPATTTYHIHHFPKGAMVGTILHEYFEKIDFQQPESSAFVTNIVEKLKLEPSWYKPLVNWLESILAVPLNHEGLTLSDIKQNQRLNELQFYLPIRHTLTAVKLDKLIKQHDLLSRHCPPLNFNEIEGMLKGFIDMIFEWQGQYYIVDYKTNWLGYQLEDYHLPAIERAMCEHRYDLQYQLYTLALHRYLKSRLMNYQYEQHFGGVFYLFVRGMDKSSPQSGIFHTKPSAKFITELDELFG